MILLTVIIGTFLGRLDQTIVNLALPKIINDFATTVSSAGWIATAYILANAVFVPVWGKLGDTIGRKKVYILGFAIFILGSVLAGLAWNLSSLIVFRIIQAIAGSADYPTAMAILTVTFKPGKERAQALGIWSSSFAAASVFGPLIGGPLIDNFGWRSVFLVNLPIGLIGLLMALMYIDESVSERPTSRFDWFGAITLGVALSALVLVLDQGLDWGWFSFNSLISYAVILIFSGLFTYIERRHPEPIVDFKFFKNSIFMHTLFNNFIIFMGYNATEAGYLFIPMAMGFLIASPFGGMLTGKVQPHYVIAVSTFFAAVGIYLLSHLDPRSSALDIIIPLFVMALGMGFGMPQRTNLIAAAVPTHEIGVASSILALARNIAGAFGIAIFATILSNVTNANVLSIAQNSIIKNATPSILGQAIGLITLIAQIDAYGTIFVIAASILFIGALASLFIKVKKENATVHVMVE